MFTGLLPPRHGVRDNGDHFLGEGATTLAEVLRSAGYATMAAVGAEVTSRHWGFAQGFDTYLDELPRSADQRRWAVERPAEEVVDDALSWLTPRAGADGPWFSWVHLFDVHHPYEPPAPWDTRFENPYVGELAYADAQVGRLLAFLEESGQADDTWVIVAADHGEGLGEHGEALHGVLLYDGTARIPLVVAPPVGTSEARVVDAPASLVDVMPTVLDLAGLSAPEDLDGISLLPWIRGEAPPADRVVYAESLYAWYHFGWAPQRVLVDAEHKLIDSTTPELYARDDPRERRDLAADRPALLADRQARLEALAATLTPRTDTAEARSLTAEQTAQLQALGYLAGEERPDGPAPAGLPDPVDRLPVLGRVEEARRALQAGALDEARATLEAVLAEEPGLTELRPLLAQVAVQQGDLDAAERWLVEAREARPGASGPTASLANLRLHQGRPQEALSLAREALAVDPYHPVAHPVELTALYLLGDVDGLRAATAAARRDLPHSGVALAMEGLLAALDGAPEAREKLEEALARQPRQPIVRSALAAVHLRAGRPEAALPLLHEEVERFPPAIPARTLLARIHAEAGDWPAQQAQLEAILAVTPDEPLILHALGLSRLNQGDADSALDAARRCAALEPLPACVMLEANALAKLGRRPQAEAAAARARALAAERRGDGAGPEGP